MDLESVLVHNVLCLNTHKILGRPEEIQAVFAYHSTDNVLSFQSIDFVYYKSKISGLLVQKNARGKAVFAGLFYV